MTNNLYKILGTLFILFSGSIYTVERIIENISASLVTAGIATHSGLGLAREIKNISFFDNFFVWFLFFLGLLLLVYGIARNK
jgi:hypothetical protein